MSAHVKSVDMRADDASATNPKETNFYAVLGARPEIAQAYRPLHEAIMGPGTLERRVKTLAFLSASFVNESPYDVARYSDFARREGFSQDEIHAVRMEQDQDFTPIESAALKIARELTRTCTLDDIDSNLLILFAQPQLAELVAAVALANFDNRFTNALNIEQTTEPPVVD